MQTADRADHGGEFRVVATHSATNEMAVVDLDGAADVAGEKADLVVVEGDVVHVEVGGFQADAGAVAVGDAGAGKGEIAHGVVGAAEHEDGLALASRVGEDGPGAVAGDRQVRRPGSGALVILARVEQDGVAVGSRFDRGGEARELLAGPDGEGAANGGGGEEHQRERCAGQHQPAIIGRR